MRRITRLALWFGIALMTLTAVVLIYVALETWRATRRLNQQIAAIRAAGDPMGLSDLQQKAVPVEDNAWTYLQRTHRQVTAIVIQLGAVRRDGPYRNAGKLNADGAQLIRGSLQQYRQVLPDLKKAALCAHYDPKGDYTIPAVAVQNAVRQRSNATRNVIRLLMLHAELELFEGRRETALETALLGLRLSRQAEREPFLIGWLTALGSRGAVLDRIRQILLDGPLATDCRLMLEKELVLDDEMPGFNWAIKSERALNIAGFEQLWGGMVRLPDLANWETEVLEMMTTELELGSAPSYLVAERSEALQSVGGSLSEVSAPALRACRVGMDRVRALQRCLYVLSKLQQRGDEIDVDTLRVEDLGVRPPLSTDPFSGNPLLTLKTQDGWYVYSVGQDGDDDAASFNDGADVGAGPWQEP